MIFRQILDLLYLKSDGYKGRILNEAKEKKALAGWDYKDVRADIESKFTGDFRELLATKQSLK